MNLHYKLRQKTKDYHAQIESASLFKKILTAEITLDEYRILLQSLYCYIAPCEATIQRLPHHSLLANREKTALLKSDLLALGMQMRDISKLEPCRYLPKLYDYEHVIGYLYVLEGATLGGRIITNMLKKNLKLTPDSGTLYFDSYGNSTSAKWDLFCMLLNKIKEAQHAKIIVSACETYSKLYDWVLDYEIRCPKR